MGSAMGGKLSELDDDRIEVKLSQGVVTFICAKCGEPVSSTYDNEGDALDAMLTRDCNQHHLR